MREGCAGLLANIDFCARTFRQFQMTGNEIGMEMAFKNMADFQALLVRG